MLRKALSAALLLVGLYVVASVVLWAVGFVATVVSALVSLAILLGFAYLCYRLVAWSRRSDATEADASIASGRPSDPVERLTNRYVDGGLTEEEFERQLARELDDAAGEDAIDRELDRERSR